MFLLFVWLFIVELETGGAAGVGIEPIFMLTVNNELMPGSPSVKCSETVKFRALIQRVVVEVAIVVGFLSV